MKTSLLFTYNSQNVSVERGFVMILDKISEVRIKIES